jgi:hypothetical protein
VAVGILIGWDVCVLFEMILMMEMASTVPWLMILLSLFRVKRVSSEIIPKASSRSSLAPALCPLALPRISSVSILKTRVWWEICHGVGVSVVSVGRRLGRIGAEAGAGSIVASSRGILMVWKIRRARLMVKIVQVVLLLLLVGKIARFRTRRGGGRGRAA